jgi:hypothetical protein
MSNANPTASAAPALSQPLQGLAPQTLSPMTLGWVMKRLVLGVVILAVAFGSIAWLTYTSLESDAMASTAEKTATAQ